MIKFILSSNIVMLFLILSLNKNVFCSTKEIFCCQADKLFFKFTPSIIIFPLSGIIKPEIIFSKVDFPLPVAP